MATDESEDVWERFTASTGKERETSMASERAELDKLKAELGMHGGMPTGPIETPEELMAAMQGGASAIDRICTMEMAKTVAESAEDWRVYIDQKVVVFSEGENDVLGYFCALKTPSAKAVLRKFLHSVCQPMGGKPRRPKRLFVMSDVPVDDASFKDLGVEVTVSPELEVPVEVKEEMSVVAMMNEGEQTPGLDRDISIQPELFRVLFSALVNFQASKPWEKLRVSQLLSIEVPPEGTGVSCPLYKYMQIQANGQGLFFYPSIDAFHAVSSRRDNMWKGGMGAMGGGGDGGPGLGEIRGVLQVRYMSLAALPHPNPNPNHNRSATCHLRHFHRRMWS